MHHVAEYISGLLSEQQLAFERIDAAHIPPDFEPANYSAALVGAALHSGKFDAETTRFVQRYLAALQRMPSALLSVSLPEGGEDAAASLARHGPAQAGMPRDGDNFFMETGWRPTCQQSVAGALLDRRYHFATRLLMRRLAKQAGMAADHGHNPESTHWPQVERLVEELTAHLAPGDV